MSLVMLAGCLEVRTWSGQPPDTPPQFRAGVDVVRLDVSVLDKKRRPIRGLSAADFTVLDDGKPQPIVAFAAVDIPDAVEPAAGWMREVPSDVATNQLDVRRVIVILMDDGITDSDPGTGKMARQIARAVIDRLSPNDLAAVVFTFRGRSQNFTNDRRQLIAAAETFQPKSSAAPGPFTAATGSRGAPMLAGPPLGCAYPGLGGENCLTRTFKNVAKALEDTPMGRKTIVLIGSGYPYSFSMETLEAPNDLDDLQQTFRSLQRANVNVYPFDPSGLTNAGIIGPKLDGLRIFADHTGGRATLATNTPWEQVPQMFLENSSYYLLGIQPAKEPQDGRFRRITVKVRRPDADVRTGAGYYAPNARRAGGKRPVAPITGLDRAFGAALPSGSLPLEVSAAPFAHSDGKQAVVVITTAVRRPVSEQIAVEQLAVRAAAFDYGETTERAAHRQTAEVTLRPHASGERRFEVQSRLTVKPGRYEIRVAADAAGSSGGLFLPVEIPDFAKSRLTMSGLILGLSPTRQGDALADLLPLAPTAARVFTSGMSIVAFLRVYQGRNDQTAAIQMRARIVDAATRTVFEASTTLDAARFQSGRAADYRLDLPLARLTEGDHLLTIEAIGPKTTVRREVRFAVRTDRSSGPK